MGKRTRNSLTSLEKGIPIQLTSIPIFGAHIIHGRVRQLISGTITTLKIEVQGELDMQGLIDQFGDKPTSKVAKKQLKETK